MILRTKLDRRRTQTNIARTRIRWLFNRVFSGVGCGFRTYADDVIALARCATHLAFACAASESTAMLAMRLC
jgi:hypothetical protein